MTQGITASVGVNHINVIIGSPIIAYANEPLVQASVVSATSIQPWFLGTDSVQAAWSVDDLDSQLPFSALHFYPEPDYPINSYRN